MEVAHNASYITTMLLFFSIAMPIVVPYSHAYYSSSFGDISSSVAPDIVIPDDFSSIQQGIDHANPADIIFVRSGIYRESITINKPQLQLIGENKFTTIIDIENRDSDGVIISADGVTFQSFTVTNAVVIKNIYGISQVLLLSHLT